MATMEKDEIKAEVDHSILRFLDLARQMEAFFLQKRFLLSALKPELVVREVLNAILLHQSQIHTVLLTIICTFCEILRL